MMNNEEKQVRERNIIAELNSVDLSANTPEEHTQKGKQITIQLQENAQDNSMKRDRRMVELTQKHSAPIILSNKNLNTNIELQPIQGYADEPLLPLTKACAPLVNIIENITFYVQIALQKTPEIPSDGLTVDESASIRLYTLEWDESQQSLYSMLNFTLKYCDRTELVPYYKYLKLFLTALVKLPSLPSTTIWRGVAKDVSEEYPPGTLFIWWSFLSCTTELTVLQSNTYLGQTGGRTLFSIESINCRTIHNHSEYSTEDEVILLPGTQVTLQSHFTPSSNLHIIHAKQIVPNQIFLQPPFPGAELYPKLKGEWYRKKKYIIPMSVLAVLFIAAIIIGSVLGARPQHRRRVGTLQWNDNNWSFSCDFHDKTVKNVSTIGEDCGPTCVNDPICTHFTWSNSDGNICQLKKGNVSKSDAFFVSGSSGVCGVSYIANYSSVGTNVDWVSNDTWAYACDFPGNSFSNVLSTSSNCYSKCLMNVECTHFMWYKYNGGTCYLKQGNVSREDAFATDDPNMICGIMQAF